MRIRTVKPEFWSHPVMARLPAQTQLLALALLNHADDEGYFHADPAIVRGTCAPFREDVASVREDLARLRAAGWIELAEHPVQGSIGQIVNWSTHQKVDHPKSSKIKSYFIRENFAKPREDLALDQGSGNREQGREQGAGKAHPTPIPMDLGWMGKPADPPTEVKVHRETRVPVSELDHLRHAGARITREDQGAWQLAVESAGIDAVRAAVLAIREIGEEPYWSRVGSRLNAGKPAKRKKTYITEDGKRIEVEA